MKTKRFLSAAIFIAVLFTFFACSSGGDSDSDNSGNGNADHSSSSIESDDNSGNVTSSSSGTSSVKVGAFKAQPVAASNNMNEPKVLTSWGKRDVNWYVIYVGYIDYSLLMESNYVFYNGNGSITISMSETAEESVSKSRTSTVSNSVTFFESSTVSKNIQEVYDTKIGGGASFFGVGVEASVQETITTNYGTSVTVENTQGITTETSDAIMRQLKESSTKTVSFALDKTDPVGYYRYAWYATSDVYFIISTSSDNKELLSWNIVSAPRSTGIIETLEYSEDKTFDNSPESEIVFADDFYTKLPRPQSTCGSISYYDSEAFCDTRDNRVYKLVKIGNQTWMAENLNLSGFGYTSVCYDNSETNCLAYGRLYRWDAAMALSNTCNSKDCSDQVKPNHQGVCPNGWHIPDYSEWARLEFNAGESSTAGNHLKAKSGWKNNGNGLDTYGFTALPGGYYYGGGSYEDVGDWGLWWSASESASNVDYAYSMSMFSEYNGTILGLFDLKELFLSVRCVEDVED